MIKADDIGLFRGACIGRDNMRISHLMLKVNVHKSNVLGIGVSDDDVASMANVIGCGATNLPMKYLGVPEDKKVTWVKLKKCMASRERGGLGIGLWARVIQNLYGIDGGINKIHACYSKRSTGVPLFISSLDLKFKVWICFLCVLAILGMGSRLGFGRMYGVSLVLRRDPRGGIETSQFNALKAAIGCVTLSDKRDSWKWSLNDCNGFSVASVRDLVDIHTLVVDIEATRWNRFIPIKVNVLLWRLKLNRLPSRVNLDRKGIDIGSILCPICHEDIETVNHIFVNCGMAQDLWALLAKWWELNIPLCANILEWYDWLDDSPIPSKARLILEGVGGTLLWTIWNYRNCLMFSSSHSKKSDLWDFIASQSFLWISSRNPKFRCSWVY
ncbi:RNA-directed DNA polymerase, eukaryota, reverse transcriptase zinc-binding domain protein [Tanacetum coccineum]